MSETSTSWSTGQLVNLLRCRSAGENPRRDRQNFVGLLKIVFRAEQTHIRRSEATAAFGKRNVMIEVKVLR